MNTSWPAKPHDAQTAARIIFADHSRASGVGERTRSYISTTGRCALHPCRTAVGVSKTPHDRAYFDVLSTESRQSPDSRSACARSMATDSCTGGDLAGFDHGRPRGSLASPLHRTATGEQTLDLGA